MKKRNDFNKNLNNQNQMENNFEKQYNMKNTEVDEEACYFEVLLQKNKNKNRREEKLKRKKNRDRFQKDWD